MPRHALIHTRCLALEHPSLLTIAAPGEASWQSMPTRRVLDDWAARDLFSFATKRSVMSVQVPGKLALAFVLLTVLLDSIGLGIIIPVTPELIMELTGDGLSRASIFGGWLAFSYAIMQFVCAPILGNLSDRFGRRPILLYSVASMGIDYLVMAMAPTIIWLFAGRALAGIAGASFTAAYAYITDISSPEKRAQNFGMIGAAFGAGFVLGPAIGGLLGSYGPRTPFFVAAGLSLANFVYGTLVLPETLAYDKRREFKWRRANPVGTLLQIRRYPAVLGMLAALLLWQIAHQVMPSIWTYYTMLKFGWSEAMIGASLASFGALMVLGQSTLPRIVVPRLGEHRTALLGLIVGGAGFVGYAFASHGWMMFALQATWLLGALVMPSTQSLLSQRVPRNAQGELQGAVASLVSVSAIIGPPLMTQLFRRFTAADATANFPGVSFIFSALLAVSAFIILRASETSLNRTPNAS